MLCSAVIAPKVSSEVPAQVNEGWERVKRIFEKDDDIGTISPEISSIVQTTLLTALTGACYGGFMQSREGYLRFFENNQATQFTDHFEAKKKLQDTVTLNFAKGAMKWSWRLALFGCMYTTSVTVLATYRGDDSIFDFIAAGFLSGSLYRIKYGLRGVIVGGSLGLMIGLFAGSVTLAVLRLSDTKLDQIRKAQADLDHFRKKTAADAVNKGFIHSRNPESFELMETHDKTISNRTQAWQDVMPGPSLTVLGGCLDTVPNAQQDTVPIASADTMVKAWQDTVPTPGQIVVAR
ncbi:Tim17/Tim22/Tim23/Pmp24 family [Nesidiocoris tenuis]|nr:Tim17/Tim22/Tim23/Pmp24 family [Nesidiocoris tenuis]